MRSLTLVFFVCCFVFAVAPARADLAAAQDLFEQGRARDALVEVESVLATQPGNDIDAAARFLQGIIYADLGQTDRAVETFAGLTQDYPELPEPYNNLAVLFAEQGEFEKARDALLSAIQTHPSYSTAHENLGDLYAKMAGMAYDRALEEDKANQSARLKLSAVNGLFSAPAPQPEPVRVAATTPAPAPVTRSEEPPIVESEPIPETVPAVSRTEPQPAPVTTEPQPTVVAAINETQRQTQPQPVVPAIATDAEQIRDMVRAWAKAWSDQNVEGYLNAYASDFRPANGAPLQSWISYRRQRLAAPSFIDVQVGDVDVEMMGDDRARATFVQTYRSDNYRDQVVKTLNLRYTGSGWQITSEVSEAI